MGQKRTENHREFSKKTLKLPTTCVQQPEQKLWNKEGRGRMAWGRLTERNVDTAVRIGYLKHHSEFGLQKSGPPWGGAGPQPLPERAQARALTNLPHPTA